MLFKCVLSIKQTKVTDYVFLLGTFCELQIDYCASLPCMNGAMCSNVPSRGMLNNAIETHKAMASNVSSNSPIRKPFLCKCPPEFHGAECEVSEIFTSTYFDFINDVT